ncbi:MAG: hypothetical protein C4522_08705 [Desulfobacteraceae bacterium]|nr:MAG: hypothetical protein C4522_08705 [Desulfobacteraceae bacterium]
MSLKNRIENLESKLKVQIGIQQYDNNLPEKLWDGILQIEMSIGGIPSEQAIEQILKRFGLKDKQDFIELQRQQILSGGK